MALPGSFDPPMSDPSEDYPREEGWMIIVKDGEGREECHWADDLELNGVDNLTEKEFEALRAAWDGLTPEERKTHRVSLVYVIDMDKTIRKVEEIYDGGRTLYPSPGLIAVLKKQTKTEVIE